jgi:hypothetical protein
MACLGLRSSIARSLDLTLGRTSPWGQQINGDSVEVSMHTRANTLGGTRCHESLALSKSSLGTTYLPGEHTLSPTL